MARTIHTTTHHAPARVQLVKCSRFGILDAECPQGIDDGETLAENSVHTNQDKEWYIAL